MSGPLRWATVIVEQAGQRRALVVSYEPFHRSDLLTVCPITVARSDVRYPGDVTIPAGEAGQTRDGVIVCSQLRTVSARRAHLPPVGYLTDPDRRRRVRRALAHHLGLDIPAVADGVQLPGSQ